MRHALADLTGKRVLDLYCGTGESSGRAGGARRRRHGRRSVRGRHSKRPGSAGRRSCGCRRTRRRSRPSCAAHASTSSTPARAPSCRPRSRCLDARRRHALRDGGDLLLFDEHPVALCVDGLMHWRESYFDEGLRRLGQVVNTVSRAGLARPSARGISRAERGRPPPRRYECRERSSSTRRRAEPGRAQPIRSSASSMSSSLIVSGGVADERRRGPRGSRSPRPQCRVGVSLTRTAAVPSPCQPAPANRSPAAVTRSSNPSDFVEDDGRRFAGKRIPDVRMRQDVLRTEIPDAFEVWTDEERRRERQAAAERLADADDVRHLLAGPQLADPAEPGVDRVDDEQRAGVVTPPSQRLEPPSGGTRAPARPCTGSAITQPVSPGSGPGSSPKASGGRGQAATPRTAHGSARTPSPRAPAARSVVRAVERDDPRLPVASSACAARSRPRPPR